MILHYIKPLAFRPDGPNRWKACGLQWAKKQFYVVEQPAGGMYVATIVMDGYRGYLGEKPNSVEASQLCQAHHEQELSEWLTPVSEASIEASSQTASLPEKNQQAYEKQGLSLGEQKALLDLAYALAHTTVTMVVQLPLNMDGLDGVNERIRFAWETLDKLKRKLEGANDES